MLMICAMGAVMIDKYLLEDLSLRSDEKGELARWVIQLEADVDTERRKTAARDSVIYDRDTRIAELEAIRVDASQVFKEIGNELGCNPDNESIMMAIDALKERERRVVALAGGNAELWETMAARLEAAEAKLATPVQLPNKNDAEFWFDGVFQVAKFDRAVERAVSAAGFKFVGDE